MNTQRPKLILIVLALAGPNYAGDWPQFRGPKRDGISAETGWLDSWPDRGLPRELWRVEVGKGHSAVSIAGDRAVTMGWDGERDSVFCLNAISGKLVWKQSYPCASILQWPGPRATATIDGEAAYTLGQHGQLRAWSLADGKLLWKVDLGAEYRPDVDYGLAWSPLVQGEHLILSCGSKGLAVRKRDGSFAWGNDGQAGACASPVPFEFGGQRGVALITMHPSRDTVRIVAVDPQNGKELWRYDDWPEKWGAACVDLVIAGGKVFITTAEQHMQCARFSLEGTKLRQDWANRTLACYTGGCVLINNHIFGVNKIGLLKCIDWNTGKEKWSERGFGGHGTLIAADGKLIVQSSSNGTLAVVAADASGYRELRKGKVFKGKPETFTAPTLANGRLYCRSYAGEVVCFELRK